MTLGWLVNRLQKNVIVTIKDATTHNIIGKDTADSFSVYSDKVQDWDFSNNDHIIYI